MTFSRIASAPGTMAATRPFRMTSTRVAQIQDFRQLGSQSAPTSRRNRSASPAVLRDAPSPYGGAAPTGTGFRRRSDSGKAPTPGGRCSPRSAVLQAVSGTAASPHRFQGGRGPGDKCQREFCPACSCPRRFLPSRHGKTPPAQARREHASQSSKRLSVSSF